MNSECKKSFRKLKELIKNKKEALKTNIEPNIHDLSGAVLLQYFQDWIEDNYKSNSDEDNTFTYLHKGIKKLNSIDKFNNIKFCFSAKDKIKNYIVPSDKIIVMLDGYVDIYDHKNDKTVTLEPYSSLTMEKGEIIDFESKSEVNYYIVIELNSPFL